MAKFEIIVGSVLGASEYVADALQEVLLSHTHSAEIHLTPRLSELDQSANWVICTSTHGAGDLPDNIQPFADQLKTQTLTTTPFLVVGLGDSSYDTYCHGSIQIENIMVKAGAKLLCPALHIDVLNHPIPEDAAVEWLKDWLKNNEQTA
ncbi:FMN-binding protein MioC [Paraglaciecola sp. MB-3u-78]|jgi:MioC protein|uniref:FMN-binding protein MioC n=1 Tax=Paraglaciecola sp. MB-3u-78 TaxID=2058332 RepID=UPI000C341E01|nr:FMN-binding protein MioC [Paraglaciecola sp. MB-3u-78]PKG97894.1 nitric oxide synthase [Paraglaciecola sp. MB-3u-78]